MKDTQQIALKVDLARAGLLSNGRYSVLITETGKGYSSFEPYRLSGWRNRTEGTFLYIQDLETRQLWSSSFEPVRARPDHYDAILKPGCFKISRKDHGIETVSEVCVDPDSDTELRLYLLRNLSAHPRQLRLTTYTEVALNHPQADSGHPAFSKLFVQTEYDSASGALIARRRPRDLDERTPLFAQVLVSPVKTTAYETDRAAFIGRGRNLRAPRGLSGLAGGLGSVLDPVMCFQIDVVLARGGEQEIALLSAAGYSRDNVLTNLRRVRSVQSWTDVFLAAAQHEQVIRERASLGPRNADRYHRIGAAVLMGAAELGPPYPLPVDGLDCESELRDMGLNPDVPMIVGRIADHSELAVARLVLRARDFWSSLGLKARVLLLNDDVGSDEDTLHDELHEVIGKAAGGGEAVILRRSEEVPGHVQRAAQRMARLVVTGDRLDLLHVRHDEEVDSGPQFDFPEEPAEISSSAAAGTKWSHEELRLFNGLGGFSQDGKEYVIFLEPEADGGHRLPPAPWTNVVSNGRAGFIVSEKGAGVTWVGNSRLNRLTPWYNDPILDPFGEALYVRDEVSNVFWSPLPGPAGSPDPVEVRHGFGYSRFRKISHGISHDTVLFIPRKDPVKIVRVRLTNTSGTRRSLSAAVYAAWVLGSSTDDGMHVVTQYDDVSDAILATNPLNRLSCSRPAFATLVVPDSRRAGHTGNKRSFVGRYGTVERPASLAGSARLDGKVGAGCEPCAAFVESFFLETGESTDVIFLLGQAHTREEVAEIVERYSTADAVDRALADVRAYWDDLISGVQVESPSPAIDLMVNGWLVYQNLSCRIWGRSAFYQSGGAYGYRDQLQDAAALTFLEPEFARSQILLHARNQFEEGDVMHWWHPPAGEGIRTRFSDDLLWLPYLTLYYEHATGDSAIWSEKAPYLAGPEVPVNQDEVYLRPEESTLVENVYQHCCRAIDRSLTRGEHGLPLMGTGDWNDGMNRVGRDGLGESVWLGFFLFDILQKFVHVCERKSDYARAERYRRYAAGLKNALESAGWDGAWYRRAYYDDGLPIGSSESDECKIDALAQAWAVISGVAPPERAKAALDATEKHLVSEADGIIRLLTPPFDLTPNDPGYIRGYLPGVRENGGQYTHAALWTIMALAEAGRCERAAPLLEMLSPVTRSADVERYKVEPYVIAADVYGVEPHVGRGGWTWYTGSAGWMYRVAVESIFGVRLLGGNVLEIAPCTPSTWPGFAVHFRPPGSSSTYHIRVTGSGRTVVRAALDGEEVPISGGRARVDVFPGDHSVEVILG